MSEGDNEGNPKSALLLQLSAPEVQSFRTMSGKPFHFLKSGIVLQELKTHTQISYWCCHDLLKNVIFISTEFCKNVQRGEGEGGGGL